MIQIDQNQLESLRNEAEANLSKALCNYHYARGMLDMLNQLPQITESMAHPDAPTETGSLHVVEGADHGQ